MPRREPWSVICPTEPSFRWTGQGSSNWRFGPLFWPPRGAFYAGPGQYGLGVYPHVSQGWNTRASCPFGPPPRPVDPPVGQEAPQMVDWFLCVGSGTSTRRRRRTLQRMLHVRQKEAIVTRKASGRHRTTSFFMDMRTSGMDYEVYLQRPKPLQRPLLAQPSHTIDQCGKPNLSTPTPPMTAAHRSPSSSRWWCCPPA